MTTSLRLSNLSLRRRSKNPSDCVDLTHKLEDGVEIPLASQRLSTDAWLGESQLIEALGSGSIMLEPLQAFVVTLQYAKIQPISTRPEMNHKDSCVYGKMNSNDFVCLNRNQSLSL